MKQSVFIIFTLLFLVVLFAYVKLNQNVSVKPVLNKMTSTGEPVVSPIQDQDKVVWLQIENPAKSVDLTLVNENGGWMIQHPVASKADDRLVDGLVGALRIAAKANQMTKEKEWSEYGLDKPNLKVGVETNREGKKRYLFFGDKSPVGDALFARWDHEDQYFLINDALRKAFDLSIYSMRYKQLVQTPLNQISKIHIRTSKRDYELSVHDQKWFWMEPIAILGEQATKEQVIGVLKGLSELYIKEFLDEENKSDRTIGISMLGNSIQIWNKDESQSEILRIGDPDPTRDAVYAKRDGEETLLLISQPHIQNFFGLIENSVAGLLPKESAPVSPAQSSPQVPAPLKPAA